MTTEGTEVTRDGQSSSIPLFFLVLRVSVREILLSVDNWFFVCLRSVSLSPSLINKIAAGEVIERPASVVKELMENAIDAGATRIDVSVRQGGLEMVRVVDNGGGIPFDELPLALASHATSKLAEADDLFRVGTLGFRGEALASIAEVSRLVLRSRTPESQSGGEIEAAGGEIGEAAPCGCPPGTAVEVHNLFFNTPVRRKFLRTTATEFGHVSEAFTRIALAAPQVHFTLRHNDKPVFDLAAGEGWLDRIGLFFGRELVENLIWVESVEDDVTISGYAAHPSQSRSHNRMQYFFLERPIHPRPRPATCAGRGVSRPDDGRPPADRAAANDDAAGIGRRERPSDETRSPIPGFRPAVQPIALGVARQVPDDRLEHARPFRRRPTLLVRPTFGRCPERGRG